MKSSLKIGDILVYVFIGILVLGSFGGLYWMKTGAEVQKVVIEVDGKVVESFPYYSGMKPKEVYIEAGEGEYNIVRATPEGVDIREANCPDQVCVRWGKIKSPGQAIVCLPHKLIVRIEGDRAEEPPLDDIAS